MVMDLPYGFSQLLCSSVSERERQWLGRERSD